MEQRPREAREKEEERGRGNEIVKGMRSGAGQRAREKERERGGGEGERQGVLAHLGKQ